MEKKKIVIYINQFFGQVGGEAAADYPPEIHEGPVGPGGAYQACLKDEAEITHTIICGDNYMGSNTEETLEKIVGFLKEIEFDAFFAGPAFIAGRYGVACGNVCKKVQEVFKVPVFTSMHEENPGVEMFRREMIIFKGGKSAQNMRKDVKKICAYALKVLKGEELFCAEDEGYYGRGIRKVVFTDKMAADRVVDMLLAKWNHEPYQTEIDMHAPDVPTPLPAVKDLSQAKIAVISTGGIVPVDNPDHIQSSSATVWGKYDISKMDGLKAGEFRCIHAGIDTDEGDKNPNVIVPVDALRALEHKGMFKELHPYYYATTGTGTSQNAAVDMADKIAADMLEAGVDAALMVST